MELIKPMNKKILIPIITCVFILFSFKINDTSEVFGKQFFELLKVSPVVSEAKIEGLFISLETLKMLPKTEISEFSVDEYNEFITGNINELLENAKYYGIVWKDIKYVKTETKALTDSGIDLQMMHLHFSHGVRTFKLQLVAIPHKNKLKLIRIMNLDYVD